MCDPPNRESFTDGPPRSLTYAQADGMISAFAARLREMSLGADAIVALQMANTIDSVLALLAAVPGVAATSFIDCPVAAPGWGSGRAGLAASLAPGSRCCSARAARAQR